MSNEFIHLKTDAREVYDRFQKVNYETMSTAIRQAVRAGLVAVQKDVKTSLSSKLKNTGKHGHRFVMGKELVFGDTLQQGVRLGKIRLDEEDDQITGTVMITSTRKTDSGSYRLHILENGSFRSGERFTKYYMHKGVQKKLKKPRSTGVLKPYNFFKSATAGSNKFESTVRSFISKISTNM